MSQRSLPWPAVRDELERIYCEHRQGLYSLALSVTRRADLAEDAVHDGMVRLHRTQARPTGDIVGYVFTAVRNAAIDIQRRARVRPEASGRDDSVFVNQDAGQPTPQQAAARSELAAQAMAAVEDLPDNQREIIVLRLIAGLKFEQIAQTLGLPLGTVTTRYRRTIHKLRDTLGEQNT